MKYRELIQFNPIETVIQLRDADEKDAARKLVSSYVISDEMADKLTGVVFPHLQFDEPADNKGLLIVGNYGTGKSHLMSVISAVAEHGEMASLLTNPSVLLEAGGAKKARRTDRVPASAIAGKFKVVRTELGSTTMDFREFVCSQLEAALDRWHVNYRFPAPDKVPNYKGAFEEMMAAFEKKYPGQGLLLVVDELLDYLRSRMGGGDTAVIRDLGFLREIGEVAKSVRFRFVAGIQVALFDNPQFQFVADTLRRVKDRFQEVYIARRDVKFVVEQRLLKKTAAQQNTVREHLAPFGKYYGNMTERMDEFVRLFPVHPDYIDRFQDITMIEKREVLKTISQEMRELLDKDMPEGEPGLLGYDSFWHVLKENAAYRADPQVREVLDVGAKLEARIEASFPRAAYKPLALRIAHALCVHRLSTGDIHAKIGATAVELRDSLALFEPAVAEMGGVPADDLAGHIGVVLKEVRKTVSGTYVWLNAENDQYYIRVTEEQDPDSLIEKRADSLDPSGLDRAYFRALTRMLERTDSYHPGTHLAWEYELEWVERKAPRLGYMFFGTPNERSTAQPPRDFYLYFIQPFEPPAFKDEKKPEEVFFRLKEPAEAFQNKLRLYAAALDLATVSSAHTKTTFEAKADQYLQELVVWLQDHMATAVSVSSQGKSMAFIEWLKGGTAVIDSHGSVRDLVNAVSSTCLEPHFRETAPEYPKFSSYISSNSRAQAAQDALRGLRGVTRTRQARAVLDALDLLDGDKPSVQKSKYATYVLTLLKQKPKGQVLNRAEVIGSVAGVEYMAPDKFRLEPEWAVLVIAALVRELNLSLAIPGKKFDALSFDELVTMPVEELAGFKHLEQTKGFDTEALDTLFQVLGLEPGLAVAVTLGVRDAEEATRKLQHRITQLLDELVRLQSAAADGFLFWGQSILSKQETKNYQTRLGEAKTFLEALQPYNLPSKLKNLRFSKKEIDGQRPNLEAQHQLAELQASIGQLGTQASYLAQAEMVLPAGHELLARFRKVRAETTAQLTDETQRKAEGFAKRVERLLVDLKRTYIQAYVKLHSKARLDVNGDRRKTELMKDPRLLNLRQLSKIELMPGQQLLELENDLAALVPCYQLTEPDLQAAVICPHCNYSPVAEAGGRPAVTLDSIDKRLDKMYEEWTKTLLDNLNDPAAQESIDCMEPAPKKLIQSFLKAEELPDKVKPEFVAAVKDALSKLARLVVKVSDLRAALLEGGSPVSPEGLRTRFESYITKLMKGKDPKMVRVILED